MSLLELTAVELAKEIKAGKTTAVEAMKAVLEQIEKTDITKAKRGDVLLYRRQEGILVLHRVYRRTKDGLYMVGDNQTEIEGPLALSQVRGKMIAVRRNGKSFSTGNPLYVIFSRIWLILRPFRPVISKIIHKMHPFREAN